MTSPDARARQQKAASAGLPHQDVAGGLLRPSNGGRRNPSAASSSRFSVAKGGSTGHMSTPSVVGRPSGASDASTEASLQKVGYLQGGAARRDVTAQQVPLPTSTAQQWHCPHVHIWCTAAAAARVRAGVKDAPVGHVDVAGKHPASHALRDQAPGGKGGRAVAFTRMR